MRIFFILFGLCSREQGAKIEGLLLDLGLGLLRIHWSFSN
jgi:hypothetical protein